jgi:ribose transport system substrate-binding protein
MKRVQKRKRTMNLNFVKSTLLGASLVTMLAFAAKAEGLAPLNSDSEPDRMDWSQLDAKFGSLPKMEAGLKVGAVAKALSNEYWRSLGEGGRCDGRPASRPGRV